MTDISKCTCSAVTFATPSFVAVLGPSKAVSLGMCNNTNSNVTRNTKKTSHSYACSCKPHKKRQTQARSMELIIHYPTERAVVPTRKHLFHEACIEHHSRGRSASATDRSSFPAPIGQTASHAGRRTQCFNQAARGVTPWKHCTPNDRGRQSGCGLGPRGPCCSHRSMPSKPFVSRMYPKVWEEGQRGYIGGTGGRGVTNVPRNKPKGSSGVKRTSRCHWERASWFPGAKRAWRARASGHRCGW